MSNPPDLVKINTATKPPKEETVDLMRLMEEIEREHNCLPSSSHYEYPGPIVPTFDQPVKAMLNMTPVPVDIARIPLVI